MIIHLYKGDLAKALPELEARVRDARERLANKAIGSDENGYTNSAADIANALDDLAELEGAHWVITGAAAMARPGQVA